MKLHGKDSTTAQRHRLLCARPVCGKQGCPSHPHKCFDRRIIQRLQTNLWRTDMLLAVQFVSASPRSSIWSLDHSASSLRAAAHGLQYCAMHLTPGLTAPLVHCSLCKLLRFACLPARGQPTKPSPIAQCNMQERLQSARTSRPRCTGAWPCRRTGRPRIPSSTGSPGRGGRW